MASESVDDWARDQERQLQAQYDANHGQWTKEQEQEFFERREKILKFAKEHHGHEQQHGWMLLIILASLLLFQVILVMWKTRSPRSFEVVSFLGLWIVPPLVFLFSEHADQYLRFYTLWVVFTLGNLWFFKLASETPLHHRTPRIVYSWFYRSYQVFFALGVAGYALILLEMFGLTNIFFRPEDAAAKTWFEFGFYFLVYGIYFGVMSRDLAKLLAVRMASSIGYYSIDGLPSKHLRPTICAICGDDLSSGSSVSQLECRHSFHEGCIRGWCLIGKKDMCPYCKEKVNTRQFTDNNPWDTTTALYLQLLDGVRYLVVWQPIVIGFAQLVIHIVGLQ